MKNYLWLFLSVILFSCTDESEDFDKGSSGLEYGLNSGRSDGYNGESPGEVQVPGDRYNEFEENPFVDVIDAPVSTFSIDADGASYANIRRFINNGELPPPDAIRTEELINYFNIDYPESQSGHPLSLNGEVSSCPWSPANKLIRIGIKGKSIPRNELPPSNIVLLIDVSGSMSSSDKLELLKEGFKLLVDEFTSKDRIAIVTYAGSAGIVLESTSGDNKEVIKNAINTLGAWGSTAGAEGIITAYEIAQQNLIENGNNRIIVGTDGDFNVGVSSQEELISLIEEKRDSGIFLTVLGVGRGNLNDGGLEQIANHGNGTYEYIDNLEQARKVFIYEYNKFYPAAKDVKVQVTFNPGLVEAYRLIGYENRLLNEEDFEDDAKDAGEISFGQNVTALYEITPKSGPLLRQHPTFTINFRYKHPDEDVSKPIDLEIFDDGTSFGNATDHMVFTASVAGFAMILRDSKYKGNLTYDQILSWTGNTLHDDPYHFRAEFRQLVQKAKGL